MVERVGEVVAPPQVVVDSMPYNALVVVGGTVAKARQVINSQGTGHWQERSSSQEVVPVLWQ